MAFSDPQSITIDAIAHSLPRTGSGPSSGQFTKADGTVKLSISHSVNRRARRTLRVDHSKIAPDPFLADQNTRFSMSTYIVVDAPVAGYTNEEIQDVVLALTSYLAADTGAATAKLIGGES